MRKRPSAGNLFSEQQVGQSQAQIAGPSLARPRSGAGEPAAESMAEALARIAADWRAAWAPHRGRHRWRLLVNAPHPDTGRPTFVGCQRCGQPKPAGERQPG
jgi:hypothetical protein